MTDIDQARALGQALKKTGSDLGLRVSGFITNMDQPIGSCVGNALEVREAVEVLQGKGPPDTTQLTLTLGAEMLLLGDAVSSREEGRRLLQKTVESGAGCQKLKSIIENQGGDPKVVDHPDMLPTTGHTGEFVCPGNGFISRLDARLIGLASMRLGAGRSDADDTPDLAVGIELLKKVGDHAEKGEPVARLHYRDPERLETVVGLLAQALGLTEAPPATSPLVIETFLQNLAQLIRRWCTH